MTADTSERVRARTQVAIIRFPGKPTSGRFVYRARTSGAWYWQCDLHDEDPVPDDQYGDAVSWPDALAEANAHASVCPFVAAASSRSRHE